MKLNKGLIAVILVFALAFSVASVVQKQKEYQTVFRSAANFASAEKLPFRDVCNLLRQPTDVYGGFNFLSVFNLQGTAST